MVDASANEALLSKSYTEAYEILERIANNNYQWPSTRQPAARGSAGVHNIDAITGLSAQVTSLTNMIKAMTSAPAVVKQVAELSCVYCGERHDFDNCPGNPALVNYMGNFNRQPQNNPYSNTYNPGWKQHPNFSWSSQNRNAPAVNGQNQNTQPSGFHQQSQGQKHIRQDPITSLEALVKECIAKNEAIVQSQTISLRNLENQMGQLATAMSSRTQGSLPSNTKDPRREGKEHCKLGVRECRPTTVTLQLADRSHAYPEGKIEDVLVKVDKFIFPVDFIVLDFEADKEVPIILGRLFLATGNTLIDVQKRELTMRVNDQQVTFNVLEAIRSPDEVEDCNFLNVEEEDVTANQIDLMEEKQPDRHNRKLNKTTRKDHFSLPFIDQMLDRLTRKQYYCFLDGYSGYNQITVAPENQEKTTFTCPYGTFAFRRMPFGLCNAPSESPWYADFANYLVSGLLPPELKFQEKKKFLHDVKSYQWNDPHLYKLCSDQIIRRFVVEGEIPHILESCHAAAYGGHFSGHRIAAKVLQSGYYWPTIFKDTYEFIKYCDRCQRTGNITRRHEMPLTNILEVEVFYIWGIDFMGHFSPSFGNLYILVAVDYVSKWVEVAALPTNDTKVVVTFLQKNIFSRFGTPKAIISDEGTHFCNKVFATVMAKYGVRHKACHLPLKLEYKVHWALKKLNWDIHVVAEQRKLQLCELNELQLFSYENARIYKERTKHWHDKHIQHRQFNPGQPVLLHNTKLRLFPRKLKSRWSGPFRLLKYYPHGTVDLLDKQTGHKFKVNGHRVKHYIHPAAECSKEWGCMVTEYKGKPRVRGYWRRDCSVKNHKTTALLFPSLITSICVVSGVRLDARDDHIKNDGAFTARTIKKVAGESTGITTEPAAVTGARRAIGLEQTIQSATDSSPTKAEDNSEKEREELSIPTHSKTRKRHIIQDEEDDDPAEEPSIPVLADKGKGKAKIATPPASEDEMEQIDAELAAAATRVMPTPAEAKQLLNIIAAITAEGGS
ncbi:hypothetical protein KPL70_008579 [Citrus sinensis]|nr:hypothetical protein KPL70_008579 [Citrus sinensis]